MAIRTKANNTDNLNLTSSWVGGSVPGSGDIARWDSTVTGTNTTYLGADATWQGISITDPGGWITINATNTLTLGSSSISMGTATQPLILNCDVSMSSSQTWAVNGGYLLVIGGTLSGPYDLTATGGYGGVTLYNLNPYTGKTVCGQGFLYLGTLADGGASSSLGTSNNDPSNLVFDGGALYCNNGPDNTTDRLFTITQNGGGIYAENSKALRFSNTGSILCTGSGPRSFSFSGTGSVIEVDCILADSSSGGVLSITSGESGTRRLKGINTYTGTTSAGGTLEITNISDGGAASNIGASSNAATNLRLNYSSSEIKYIGSNGSTDRLFSINSDQFMTYQKISASGSGPLSFTNYGSIAYNGDPGIDIYPIRFGGTNTDLNWFAPSLSDYGGTRKLYLEKVDSGTWTFAGTNSYTGNTTISAGTFFVFGTIVSDCTVAGGLLGGGGTLSGSTKVNSGAVLRPGYGTQGLGTMVTGNVTFSSDSTFSHYLYYFAPTSNRIASAGTVACAGKINIEYVFETSVIGTVYTIASATSVTGTFSNLPENAVFRQQNRSFRINYTSTAVTLTDVSNDCAMAVSF